MPLDDLAVAISRLSAARAHRAEGRASARRLLSALQAEAEGRLGPAFPDDDPVTGRPACLLVTSGDRLGDDYEAQTPRPIPDSLNRLTLEILGRVLTVDIDDFGRVSVAGVAGAERLHRLERTADGLVFVEGGDAGEERRTQSFAGLLARVIDGIVEDENALLPTPREPNDAPHVAERPGEPAAAGVGG